MRCVCGDDRAKIKLCICILFGIHIHVHVHVHVGVPCCFALIVVGLTLLASFFLLHFSLKQVHVCTTYTYIRIYMYMYVCEERVGHAETRVCKQCVQAVKWKWKGTGNKEHVMQSMVSLFIRCTMRCEIWAQPAELPW